MTLKELINKYTKEKKIFNFSGLSAMVYPNISKAGARSKLFGKLNEVEGVSGSQRILEQDILASKKVFTMLRDDFQNFIDNKLSLKDLMTNYADIINVAPLGLLVYPDLAINTAKTKLNNKLNELEAGSGKQRILPHDEEAARKALKPVMDDIIQFLEN
ncbi:Uncharacterised protein [Sphingobacterium spiritivorum]|uniref:Uncharacterized protein n=1 Tax=Sphingobacterium spiritivorum TaxID=258 RepID=A0A380CHI8_SPHSI|nr:hypothetical protein [Sphingobacterium spiritivorum]SUJ19223.1 Uncharacterised protein [Sphingobacterium spiritivorum]